MAALNLILINTISPGQCQCQCQGVNSNGKRARSRPVTSKLGWALPGLVPPCRWPRFHSCGLESPYQPATPTPTRRGLERPVPGGPYSLLHLRPHQALLNSSGSPDLSSTKQPLHGLSPCSQSKHPTSLSLSVDVKLGLPEHHPPWPPQACSPRSVHTQHH